MKRIEWQPRLNLGVKQIDDQHKRLVLLTNNLISAIQSGVAADLLMEICIELLEYTEYHFQDEELLMQEVDFPYFNEHTAMHRVIEGKVREYHDSVSKGASVPPVKVLEFLGSWLVDHIIYADMKIANHIRESRSKEEEGLH